MVGLLIIEVDISTLKALFSKEYAKQFMSDWINHRTYESPVSGKHTTKSKNDFIN